VNLPVCPDCGHLELFHFWPHGECGHSTCSTGASCPSQVVVLKSSIRISWDDGKTWVDVPPPKFERATFPRK
jgi:hypothetical protein